MGGIFQFESKVDQSTLEHLKMYGRIKRNDEKIYLVYFNSSKKKYEKLQFSKLLSFAIRLSLYHSTDSSNSILL